MGTNYQDEREKRAHFGQKRLKGFMDEYESLIKRMEIEGTLTREMKIWLSENVLEFEERKRLLTEQFTLQRIQFLQDPKNRIVLPSDIKVEEIKV